MFGPTYVAELGCMVTQLTHDYRTKVGRLDMVEGESCAMRGCIDTFTRLDDAVRRIETFAGTKPGTVYVRRRDDWEAISP